MFNPFLQVTVAVLSSVDYTNRLYIQLICFGLIFSTPVSLFVHHTHAFQTNCLNATNATNASNASNDIHVDNIVFFE